MSKISEGKIGEDIACEFLKNRGYKILERNFQKRYGEIDIVAKDKDVLVFVEVKTRKSGEYGRPEEAVTPRKLHDVIKTSKYYLLTHPELSDNCRIDVVAVELNPDDSPRRIELFPNVTSYS
ncbi:MAG: YraN family protein [bacterium]|nr:YraN family protein [bacterium]